MAKDTPMRIVKLHNLAEVCAGNRTKELRYLRQFITLVPQRIAALRMASEREDAILLRKAVHKLSPQAEFFGIHQVISLKKVLEIEDGIHTTAEIQSMVSEILGILELATQEISNYLSHALDQKPE